jgi:hypothetical protein
MSALEDRVRDALRADAATVRASSIPAGPPSRGARRTRRRPGSRPVRVLIPLAAAAAVIAIVTGLSLTGPHLLSGARPGGGSPGSSPTGRFQPTPGTSHPLASLHPAPDPLLAADASRAVPSSTPVPGVPRFYATLEPGTTPTAFPNSLVVRDTATGQVTAEMKSPDGSVFAGLAATAGDRTFITAVDPGTSCAPVQLYWFQLNQLGVPGQLEPLHITVPGSVPQGEGDLAITPDGGTIAYDAQGCSAAAQGEVGIISLATRQTRAWAYAGEPPATLVSSDIHDVSLSANGQLLAFSTFDGTSVLQTSAPAGSLYAESRFVSSTLIWATVAEDGQSLYGCAITPDTRKAPSGPGTLTYSQLSLTGGGNRVIAGWRIVRGPQCYASMDPAGSYLLMQFPAIAHGTFGWSLPAILDLATGQRTPINAPAFYGPRDIAW